MARKQDSKTFNLRLAGERPQQRMNTNGVGIGAGADQVPRSTGEAQFPRLSSVPMTREERLRYDTFPGSWADDQGSIQQTRPRERSGGQAEEEEEGISLADQQELPPGFDKVGEKTDLCHQYCRAHWSCASGDNQRVQDNVSGASFTMSRWHQNQDDDIYAFFAIEPAFLHTPHWGPTAAVVEKAQQDHGSGGQRSPGYSLQCKHITHPAIGESKRLGLCSAFQQSRRF